MSYILEALKMSEQSRRQSAEGTQYSLLPAIGEEAVPRHTGRHLLLVGALLINAVALSLWLRPASPGTASGVQAQKTLLAAAQPATTPAPRAAAQPGLIPPPAAVPVITAPPAPAPAAVAPISSPPKADVNAEKHAAKKAMAPAPAKPEPVAETAAADGPSTNLPKQLPPISVAGFIRDEGAPPLVIVNDKLLSEGDEVSPGLKLEKILDDGLVFNFKGYRFKR